MKGRQASKQAHIGVPLGPDRVFDLAGLLPVVELRHAKKISSNKARKKKEPRTMISMSS